MTAPKDVHSAGSYEFRQAAIAETFARLKARTDEVAALRASNAELFAALEEATHAARHVNKHKNGIAEGVIEGWVATLAKAGGAA